MCWCLWQSSLLAYSRGSGDYVGCSMLCMASSRVHPRGRDLGLNLGCSRWQTERPSLSVNESRRNYEERRPDSRVQSSWCNSQGSAHWKSLYPWSTLIPKGTLCANHTTSDDKRLTKKKCLKTVRTTDSSYLSNSVPAVDTVAAEWTY